MWGYYLKMGLHVIGFFGHNLVQATAERHVCINFEENRLKWRLFRAQVHTL